MTGRTGVVGSLKLTYVLDFGLFFGVDGSRSSSFAYLGQHLAICFS